MAQITNDQLAKMIKDGFDAVDKRFASLDSRSKTTEDRLASVERRLFNIENRLDRIEGHVADVRSNQGDLIDVLQGKNIITKEKRGKLRSRIFGTPA